MNYPLIRNFFLPLAGTVTLREKMIAGITAFVGMLTVTYISMMTTGSEGLVIMAASMGSAAILLFAIPHSPMSQPWPLIGGHLVSALVGVLCYRFIAIMPVAAALAVAVAIVMMFFLRCLNPPSGAVALGAVMGGPEIHDLGYFYILFPVAFNILVIFLVALIINNILPGRRYPLMPQQNDHLDASLERELAKGAFHEEDLESAMEGLDSYLDVDREDLKKIFSSATMHAYKRRLGNVSSADIMTSDPVALDETMMLDEAWGMLTTAHLQAVPVIDSGGRVSGMLTLTDLIQHAVRRPEDTLGESSGPGLAKGGDAQPHAPMRVAEIMSRPVISVSRDCHIVDIIPMFSEKGIHQLPVLDADGSLCGIITRSDIMRAMLPVRI